MPTYSAYIEDVPQQPNSRDNILAKLEQSPALIQADIAANRVMGGGNETISARVGREQKNSLIAKALADQLNTIDPGHTDRALANSPYGQAGPQGFSPYVEPPPRTPLQQIGRGIGLAGRAGIQGITGTAGVLSDALMSGANLFGANRPMPSKELDKFLTMVGLPTPETKAEKVSMFLGSVMSGGADPLMKGLQAVTKAAIPVQAGFSRTAARQAEKEMTQKVLEAGYKLPPSMVPGAPTSLRVLEGLGGASRTQAGARYANEASDVGSSLARKALGMPENAPLTAEALARNADDLIKAGYDPIKKLGTITTGRVYRQELADVAKQFSQKSFPGAQSTAIDNLIAKFSQKSYQGDDAVSAISMLRREARDAFKPGGDSSLGLAKLGVAKALENNIELNLAAKAKGGAPQAAEILKNFRDARVGLAKTNAVEKMLVDPTSGIISAPKAAAMLQRGAPLTGELKTIAQAGSPILSKATGVATGGKPPMWNTGDTSLAVLGGAASPFTAGLSSMLGAVPLARGGARAAILSNPAQAMMLRKLLAAGPVKPGLFAGDLAQRLGISTANQVPPLFSQGEQ